jgi:predicted secreted hydrolase
MMSLLLVDPHYKFPRDHFEHRDYKTEWWYYTGNVRDAGGHRFGFELVFFRVGRTTAVAPDTPWAVEDMYLAHAAVTDIDEKQFRYAERLNRAGPGIAGASFAEKRIWNGNWKSTWTGEKQRIEALWDDFSFALALEPMKPLTIHGANGIGPGANYVSFMRMRAGGTIRAGNTSYEVTGQAWMDHEWFSEQFDPARRGWDWFSAQWDDGTELMLFELRRKDGTIDPDSAGTFVDRNGAARHLTAKDFSLVPEMKHGLYPVKWRLLAPGLGVDVTCTAAVMDQELHGRTNYWEGAVTYSGSRTGVGYLEMTGYDKPVTLK